MNIKSIINRECFIVTVDWKEIPLIKQFVDEHEQCKQLLDKNGIEICFISFKDTQNQPLDDNPAYYCYIGMAGEHDMFELGVFGGTKEQLVNNIKSGELMENIEKYPNGFDRYVAYKLIEYLKQLLRFAEMSELNEKW